MNFEQALSHMKRGGTVKLGRYSYKFASNTTNGILRIAIIESEEGREQSRALWFVSLTTDALLSNDWELTE